jgi:cysteinyl-tRNA synthetase
MRRYTGNTGPILEQVSHIGHARNYLSADIIRRVMEDYFGYRIRMVMNVTDVDDKIILKARRQHLLRQYKNSKPAYDQVVFWKPTDQFSANT